MLIRTACWVPLLAQTLCAQGLPHGGRGNMKELSSYLEIQKAKKVKGPCFSGFERWPSISITENENTRREAFFPLYLLKHQPSALIPNITQSQNTLFLQASIFITFSKERLPCHLPMQSWSQASDVPTTMKQSYPSGPNVDPRIF